MLHLQTKMEEGQQKAVSRAYLFSLSASGVLTEHIFFLRCEFIWIQSFEKDKVFLSNFFPSSL